MRSTSTSLASPFRPGARGRARRSFWSRCARVLRRSGWSGRPANVSSPELVAALEEPPGRPGRELLRLLRADGLRTPAALMAALALAAAGVIVEAVLFRGLFDLDRELGLAGQRLGAMGALLIFVMALL